MPVHTIHFRSGQPRLVRALKWVGIVVVALVALLLLAAAALASFGGDWLRGPIERSVQDKTGRALKIGGDLRFGFSWPLRLRVQAGQVAFANADWARQPPDMFTADEMDFTVALLPLLVGRKDIDQLHVGNASVALEKDAEGHKNWELPGGGQSTVNIGRVALDNGRIDFTEPARKTAVHADLSTTAKGLEFSAKGRYLDAPVESHGSGGSLLALRDESEPYPFDIDLKAGPSHLKAQGTVTGLQNVTALDAKAEADGDNLERLFPLLGIALPETPPYRTAGHVVHQGKLWRYEKFSAHMGSSDVSGTVQIDTSGKRPSLTGEAVFGLLDVADLGATVGTREERDRALPESRFHTDRWKTVDADVKLTAQRILRPHEIPIEHFAARLRMKDAVLTLDPLEFGIAGGHLTGTVKLDGSHGPIRADAKVKIAGIALDKLVPGFNPDQIDTGRIDGNIDLKGSGDNVAQMLGSSNGSAAMLVNGGHVSQLVMEELGLHIPRIVLLKLGGDKRIPIRCAAADFRVEDGVMHSQTFVFDTAVTNVQASGDIKLSNESLNLTLNPQTKETALLSLHTPIHIRGTFSKPDVQLEKGPIAAKSAGAAALAIANPLLALIPLIEAGPGKDSDCGRLLTESPAAQDATPGGAKKAAPAE